MKFKKDDAIRIKHQPEKLWLVSDPYCPTDMTRVRNGSADNTPPEKVGYYVEIQSVDGHETYKYHEDSLEHDTTSGQNPDVYYDVKGKP